MTLFSASIGGIILLAALQIFVTPLPACRISLLKFLHDGKKKEGRFENLTAVEGLGRNVLDMLDVIVGTALFFKTETFCRIRPYLEDREFDPLLMQEVPRS